MCLVTSVVSDSVTPWTVALPLTKGFSRQEYWSGLPCSSSGDLPHSGTELGSPASSVLAGRFSTAESPGKPRILTHGSYFTLYISVCEDVTLRIMQAVHGWLELAEGKGEMKPPAASGWRENLRLTPDELLLKRACWGRETRRKATAVFFMCCPGEQRGNRESGRGSDLFQGSDERRAWQDFRVPPAQLIPMEIPGSPSPGGSRPGRGLLGGLVGTKAGPTSGSCGPAFECLSSST